VTSPGANVTPLRPKRPCPECGRPSARDTYPFCSARCKNVDLGRWLTGAYVIPEREGEDEDGTPGSSDTDPDSGSER